MVPESVAQTEDHRRGCVDGGGFLMQSQASTVEEYLAKLPPDRRDTVQAVREVILKNLPAGYEEGMQYGIIGYFVPHSLYPAGYHCNPKEPLPFVNLASQKQYISVYLYCVYSDEQEAAWFRQEWEKTGKKLNMGKSCVRFRKLDDVPLNVIGQAVKRIPVEDFIANYEAAIGERGKRPKSKTHRKTARKTGTMSKSPARRKKQAPRRDG